MRVFRFYLLLFVLLVLFLDHHYHASVARNSFTVFMQKQLNLILYRVSSYPSLLMLKTQKQQELALQNTKLQKQLEETILLLQQSNNKINDLRRLQEINLVSYNNFTGIIATAILDINFLANSQLLIDRGKKQHISLGDAVVTKNGVIGQVIAVTDDTAQVATLTKDNFNIYVQNITTKAKMLAHGTHNTGVLVQYIPNNTKINIGEVLETTGLDDVFPANLPVLKVVKVFNENNGFNSALCVPVVDFRRLQYVLVLHNAHSK